VNVEAASKLKQGQEYVKSASADNERSC